MSVRSAESTGIDLPEGRTSTECLLRAYAQFAIPHFQRGLVWDAGSVAGLLESLFHGTPCGAIILWAPPNAADHGVGLGELPPTALIVDGQQRIRSLHRVFAESSSDEADAEEGDDEAIDAEPGVPEAIWCLNLGRLAQFQSQFPGGRRFGLFRRARDPRTISVDNPLSGAPRDDAATLVPLNWFLERDDALVRHALGSPDHAAIRDAVTAVLADKTVTRRLRGMTGQPVFSVSTLDPAQSYQDVIAVYNRINSSGRRVEAEEKAFANMVGVCAGAELELKRFFEILEHKRNALGPDALERDGLLQRKKENQFGFKLFMRSFVISLAYHSCRSVGGGSLSFDSANPDALRASEPHLSSLLKDNSRMLAYVEDVLRHELHCDDLRFLPETASLWPVFQLLIRFPELMQKARLSIASVVLRLMLANLEKRQLLALCRGVNEAHDGREALNTLQVFESPSAAEKRIRDGVKNAQALTDRFVLMLYWLLRRRGATDFSYSTNVTSSKAVALLSRYGGDAEPQLSEVLAAERQHLVPYGHLKRVFGLDGARPGRHAVNDIGNLTFISAGLNSFTTGVGDEPLKLEHESSVNRRTHFLDAADVLADYSAVCRVGQDSGPTLRQAEKLYSNICDARKTEIADALVAWEGELLAEATAERLLLGDVPPARRLIKPASEDRLSGYPREVAKRLGSLVRGGMKMNLWREEAIALTHTPPRGQQVLRIDLASDGSRLGFKFAKHGFADAFVSNFPDAQVSKKTKSVRFKLATDNQSGREQAVAILDWVAEQLRPEQQSE